MLSVEEFLLASLVMGLGIGTDVALATFLRAEALTARNEKIMWLGGVTLTHTLFPMAGYLLAYFSINSAPLLTPLVGVVAFSCIAYFVYSDLVADSEESSDSNQLMVTLGLILAVSWDALWSGPAKSAQVMGWPEMWVWGSFILVGIVVAVFALVGLALGRKLSVSNVSFSDHSKNSSVSRSLDFGRWLQLSAISYFGWLALARYTLNWSLSWWLILLFSFSLLAVLLLLQQRRYRLNLKMVLPAKNNVSA